MEPFKLSQEEALYVERIRYSCDCRGLIRVYVLSALMSSVSKLIRQLLIGRAHMPNKPEYSLISVLPASISASGVTKVKDPSPLAVQPVGSKPPTSAQSPRFALLGKKSSST